MNGFLSDIRCALRRLRQDRGLTAVALITLALGIGINSAVFSVAHNLLFRPLPFHASDRLVALVNRQTQTGDSVQASWADLQDLRTQTAAFSNIVSYRTSLNSWISTQTGGRSERVTYVETSQGFFSAVGVAPLLGRFFSQAEYQPRRYGTTGRQIIAPVVISYRLWQSQFGGRPDILGQTFTINADRGVVVGVMPPNFRFFRNNQSEIYCPASEIEPANQEWRRRSWEVFARLQRGVNVQQARALMAAFAKRRENEDRANNGGITTEVENLHDHLFGHYWKPFPLLFGTAGLLLMITCASVANLLLSRAASREREIALRTAMGATRWRIVRQLTVESGVLAMAGGLLGLLFSHFSLRLFNLFSVTQDMALPTTSTDGLVLAFGLLLTVITGLIFGLAPSLHLAGTGDSAALVIKGASGVFSGRASANRLGAMLVTAEVALSIALLVGMGLVLKALWNLSRVPLGFETERVLLLEVGKIPYVDSMAHIENRAVFWPQFLEKIEAMPSVQAAAFADDFPASTRDGDSRPTSLFPITFQGQQLPAPGYLMVEAHEVTSGYFRAMGIPLLRGRFFGHDLPTTKMFSILPEALVSERFAREQWPNQDPIGYTVVGPHNMRFNIVGVVGDVKQHGQRQDVPQRALYVPLRYWDFSNYESQYLVLRTRDSRDLAVTKITAAVQSLDPQRTVLRARTMEEIISGTTAWDRLKVAVVALFGVLALLLTLIGVYGTVARAVASRTKEIGIRMALGSRPDACVGLVMRQGLHATWAGLGLGLILAWAVARALSNQFFGVSPADPAIYAAVTVPVSLAAIAACYFPARRAAKVDPVVALRYE